MLKVAGNLRSIKFSQDTMTWLRSKVKLDRCEIVSRSVISTSGHNIQVKLLVEADKFEPSNLH